MKIAAFYPNFFHIAGIAYAALSIIEEMQSEKLDISLMGICSGSDLAKSFYRNAIPSQAGSIAYRLLSERVIKKIAERRFSYSLAGSEHVYLWPGISLALYRELHARGHRIIMENVNTHQATSKAILDAEYKRLGLARTHGISDADAEEETLKLDLADFVFSCSPEVTASLLGASAPRDKILETSYGLRASDILPECVLEERKRNTGITAIFVGTIGVRKGPHLLLDYWCQSGIKGNLKLVGDIQPEVRHLIEPYLNRPDIEHIPYVNDLTAIYRSADLFVLPSLEEGSPLVTYLALGAGLPCLVSPMGGGGVVEHEKEGLIMHPHDAASWIAALQRLSGDSVLRESFSRNAYHKAPQYLWSEVGPKRAALLMAHLGKGD